MDASNLLSNNSTQIWIDWWIARIATRQHGVIARRQLLGIGLTAGEITYRIKVGRLHRLHRGVYSVGHESVSVAGRRMAAVLACGPSAFLSHRTAGGMWALIDPPSGPIDVTTARRNKPKRDGVRSHLSVLPDDEVDRMDNIPITTMARTIVDLSSTKLSDTRMRVVLAKAEQLELDWAVLRALVDRHARRPGVPRLRRLIADDLLDGVPASELEIRFLEWLVAKGLPLPQLNQNLYLNGAWIRPDCMWREQRVIAEVDSRKHHNDWAQRQRDNARHTALAAQDWKTVRVTAHALAESNALERDLRALLL
jgi:predicted transcriptional regulator of viral defense system